jgi:hypothetical protein
MDTALTLLALSLILLPGWALWMRLAGPQPSQEVAISGLAFAAALAIVALYVTAYLSLTAFLAVWVPAAVAAVASLMMKRPRVSIDRALLVLALAAAAVRFLPVLALDYPRGWDPNFHLLVVHLIEQRGAQVGSLSPFEDIPINYPTGAHLLLALIAKYTASPSYTVYSVLLAAFASLACLQVYAWVHAATSDRRWALCAMAAYAFLAVQGSFDYLEWGGLPNLIGIYLLAGCLTIVLQPDAGERRWWALPVMYLAIAALNHHVLLTAFAVMLGLSLWFAARPERRAEAKRLLLGGCLAAVAGIPALAQHFLSAGQSIHETGLLLHGEPVSSAWFIAVASGIAFFLAVLAGAACYVRDAARPPLRGELLVAAAAMLALFALFEYGGRQIMLALYERPIAPFTPSRFLTDAVLPLSAFAGFAFLRIEQRLRRSVLPLVAALALTNLPVYAGYFRPAVDADRLAAYRWVLTHTPPDTLVIDPWVQAPVLTRRVASNTALPSSELWARASKRALLARIQNGEVRPESTGRPVVLITYGQEPLDKSTILFRHPGGCVVDLNPKMPARPR